MPGHNLFYYPYASFTDEQLPLLKVAALYFDTLSLLDPVGAGLQSIGAGHDALAAVRQLSDAGMLQPVSPADVLATYSGGIAEGIRRDMLNPEFQRLCADHGGGSWFLSLAKVPHHPEIDQLMRELMGDFARAVSMEAASARDGWGTGDQGASALRNYVEGGRTYEETNPGYDSIVEYRFAEFPLPLGEAIMMNHALYAGLLYSDAMPVTDDPFHNQALSVKLKHAAQDPETRQILMDRAHRTKQGAALLALAALTDDQLRLPILDPRLSLETVLEYRARHEDELQEVREKLAWMARRIEAEPWSDDFARELHHKTIPDLGQALEDVRKSRDAWIKSKRSKLGLAALGIAAGTATAVLTIIAAPLTPIALATGALSLTTGAAIPGASWLLDWRDGKETAKENGLHYLLMYE
jgi:hypothetical protein